MRRAIMHFAFGRVRRRIALLRTDLFVITRSKNYPIKFLIFIRRNLSVISFNIKFAHLRSMSGGETLGETPKPKHPTGVVPAEKSKN